MTRGGAYVALALVFTTRAVNGPWCLPAQTPPRFLYQYNPHFSPSMFSESYLGKTRRAEPKEKVVGARARLFGCEA